MANQYYALFGISLISAFLSFSVVMAILCCRRNVLTYRLIGLLCLWAFCLHLTASFVELPVYNKTYPTCITLYFSMTFFNSCSALTSVLLSFCIYKMLKYGSIYQRLRDQLFLLLGVSLPSLIIASLWIFPLKNYISSDQVPGTNYHYCSNYSGSKSRRDIFLSEFIPFRLPVLISVVGSCVFLLCALQTGTMSRNNIANNESRSKSYPNPVVKEGSKMLRPEGMQYRQSSTTQLKTYQLFRLLCFPGAFVFSQIFDMIGHVLQYQEIENEFYYIFMRIMLCLEGTFFFITFLIFPKSREVYFEFLAKLRDSICQLCRKTQPKNHLDHVFDTEENFDLGERDSDLDSVDIELRENENSNLDTDEEG